VGGLQKKFWGGKPDTSKKKMEAEAGKENAAGGSGTLDYKRKKAKESLSSKSNRGDKCAKKELRKILIQEGPPSVGGGGNKYLFCQGG